MQQTKMFSHEHSRHGKDEWLTPPWVLKALGEFDLDPCAPIKRPWPMAKNHFTIEDNGLTKSWFDRVWCNPPYSDADPWLRKLSAHGHGIALTFARTGTRRFFNWVWPKASGMLFLKGRLTFYHVNGKKASNVAGAPSVLIAYGDKDAKVLKECGIEGAYVTCNMVIR